LYMVVRSWPSWSSVPSLQVITTLFGYRMEMAMSYIRMDIMKGSWGNSGCIAPVPAPNRVHLSLVSKSNGSAIRSRRSYTFRHTIITDVYEETHDANIAAAVAGHSKTTITMNRYAHARRDSAVRSIKVLDEAYNL